ncbi:acyltransferase [Chaetomium fimeti]|uniref:Acyltransferase n=1 Tax=Chaetomium fimeti TaxID=1854472 RepID=A0AAE0HLQ1_9PEZI|nr:acyltransferase [Chaetomium fimeti]
MPHRTVHQLHPFGWENDPEEERFKVTTLDYLTACTYNNYALFFRLDDVDKEKAAATLKTGLERTLSQARHYVGTIEKDPEGGHSFVKRKGSTVRFVVQWLDAPEESTKYPSIDDVETANYSAVVLGNLETWSVPPMTYGEKPEAHPDSHPVVSAFQANFVRGGLVLNMHHHHYANDVMGWSGFTHQLAENCRAALNNTPFPTWDPICLDLSRLIKKEVADEVKVDGPPQAERHPDHKVAQLLLFHLPKSKAAELKTLAAPTDGSWISTYDAFSAFLWRTLTRLRAPVFKPEPSSHIFWAEAIDMRRRMHSPKVHPRIQHNVMFAALSTTAPIQQLTADEILHAPLSTLASYVRRMTNSVTQESLDKTLDMVAMVRDKTSLNIRIDSHPPMSILMTDHRDANIVSADFGFATPLTYRHLLDRVTEGVIIIYPTRNNDPESDEGPEFSIAYEKHLAHDLINDAEFKKYFEYRGVDAEDAGSIGANGSS